MNAMSGEIVSIQYIQAVDISAITRAELKLPATGWIKKVIKLGSVNVEMTPIDRTPSADALKSFASLKVDFSSLKDGDVPKKSVEKK